MPIIYQSFIWQILIIFIIYIIVFTILVISYLRLKKKSIEYIFSYSAILIFFYIQSDLFTVIMNLVSCRQIG